MADATYYLVETIGREFSAPVRFETLGRALRMAVRWRADGALQVRGYRMTEGDPSGVEVFRV